MHVLIDGTPAINDERAIKRYVSNLISELSVLDRSFEISVLYLGFRKGVSVLPQSPDSGNMKIHCSSANGRMLRLMWSLLGWPDISFWVKGKPEIMHFPGAEPYIPAKGSTILSTMHGFARLFIPEKMGGEKENSRRLRILEESIRKTDRFITVSETNRIELSEKFGVKPGKIRAIPLGVGAEFSTSPVSREDLEKIRKKYSLGDKRIILFVGVIAPHKNIDGLIRAYAELPSALRKSSNLVLAGPMGSDQFRKEYAEMARKCGVSEAVKFTGRIPEDSCDLPLLYKCADMLVFPSFYEGWASPPLEAMKSGVPAILSDIPSLRESSGGNALFCNPDDPHSISDSICRMVEDTKLREKLIGEGLSFAGKFTWRICAEKTLEYYREIASS